MRSILRMALFLLALTSGCQNVYYDSAKGYYVAEPEKYEGPPPPEHRWK
jgi:hypothetical protein